MPGKLTPFESKLLLALEADAHRPKRDRRTALMLFAEIKREGYTGGYTMITDSSATGAIMVPRPRVNRPMYRSGLSWVKRFSLIGAKNI